MSRTKTLVLVKPHAVAAGHTPEIIERYTDAGLKITKQWFFQFTPQTAKAFYQKHDGKSFFPGLLEAMCEGKTEAMLLEGEGDVIMLVRQLNGATKPSEAEEGTIRRDFKGTDGPRNVVHGSDSAEAVAREIALIFPD